MRVILFDLHTAEGVFRRINLVFRAGRKAHSIVEVGLGNLIFRIDLQCNYHHLCSINSPVDFRIRSATFRFPHKQCHGWVAAQGEV